MLQARASEDVIWSPWLCEGWAVDGWGSKDESGEVLWKLVEFPDEPPKSCVSWAQKLGVDFLRYDRTTVKRVFPDDGGLWESTHASLRARRLKLQRLLADAEASVEAAKAGLAAASGGATMAPLGGELLHMVYGPDTDTRQAQSSEASHSTQ